MLKAEQFPGITVENRPPQFPELLDATSIRDFRSCPSKWYFAHVLKRVPNSAISPHLHAGKAFASALETFRNIYFMHADYQHSDDLFEHAFAQGARTLITEYGDYEPPPQNSNKSCDNMLSAYDYCLREAWPPRFDAIEPVRGADDKPAVEFTGAIPLPLSHPVSGAPLLYTARFDMFAKWKDGTPGTLGVDEKTANSLGPYWTKQWDMRSQFMGYTTVARAYGYDVTGFLVRGISILKTKHDHLQVILQFPEYKLERWWDQTIRTVSQMLALYERGEFDQNFDEACASYGGCQYRPLCEALDPIDWMSDYVERKWNPLAKDPSNPTDEEMGR